MFADIAVVKGTSDQHQRLLERFGSPRHTETRSSDNPLGAIWRDLQRYSGLQRARTLFDNDANDGEIRTFCAYIELADSYAALAEEADPAIDPLLLYYSAMWLSRALIAAKLGIGTAEKQKAHGSRPIPGKKFNLAMLGGSILFQRRGTLPATAEALGGDNASGVAFEIVDLLRALPEMDVVLRDTIGLATTALPIYVRSDVLSGHHQVDISGITLPQEANDLPIAPALASRGAKIATYADGAVIWHSDSTVEDEVAALFIRTPEGYFAETRIRGMYVPELVSYLAILHSLSEFTRYYPREWLDVYADHGSDHAIIREFMHFAERKIPELVLNELSRRKVVYRHA